MINQTRPPGGMRQDQGARIVGKGSIPDVDDIPAGSSDTPEAGGLKL